MAELKGAGRSGNNRPFWDVELAPKESLEIAKADVDTLAHLYLAKKK